jgi:AcrR family transcriptional regulator
MTDAARVFAGRGFQAASVEEIAEEAGYSHGAVYSNFEGKADLFLAVFENYMAERVRELADTQAALGEDAPLEVRARALADLCAGRPMDGPACA